MEGATKKQNWHKREIWKRWRVHHTTMRSSDEYLILEEPNNKEKRRRENSLLRFTIWMGNSKQTLSTHAVVAMMHRDSELRRRWWKTENSKMKSNDVPGSSERWMHTYECSLFKRIWIFECIQTAILWQMKNKNSLAEAIKTQMEEKR